MAWSDEAKQFTRELDELLEKYKHTVVQPHSYNGMGTDDEEPTPPDDMMYLGWVLCISMMETTTASADETKSWTFRIMPPHLPFPFGIGILECASDM